jgi:hypothetical protein
MRELTADFPINNFNEEVSKNIETRETFTECDPAET